MARTTNKVFLSGRIARPELKHTNSGMAIFTCSLAIDDSYKKRDDTDWTQKTIWMYVKAFDKKAERFQELQKGIEVLIEGKLKQDEDYTDKDGKKRNGSHYIDPEKITPIENLKRHNGSNDKALEDAIQVCRQTGLSNQELSIAIALDNRGNPMQDEEGDWIVINSSTGEVYEKVPF